jgi:glycosyltransferase involved in cell wall biosynthesis
MCPIYAVAAAPVARPLGVPVALWFTHWKRSRLLVLADRLSTRAFSVDRRTYPVPSRKLVPIGHGIDVSEFACLPRPEPNGRLRVLCLGRTSPAKGLDLVLDAVEIAGADGLDVSLDVYGPSLTDEEHRHRVELQERAAGLDGKVRIHDVVPHGRVPELLAQSDCLVNNMREGATDKVVYEAAASCVPVLASNTAFEDVIGETGLDFPRGDAAALAARFGEVAAMSKEQRAAVGGTLRDRVVAGHSVDAWAEKLLAGLA